MLKKLYKHEFHSLLRTIWPIYLLLFVLAIFNRLSFLIDTHNNWVMDTLKGAIMFFYVLSIVAIFIVGVVIVVIRFYKHLLTSEGYLTFTLPVTVTQHLVCKLLCGITVMVLNTLGVIGSVMILVAGNGNISGFFHDFGNFFSLLSQEIGVGNVILYVAGLILLCLLALAFLLLMFYVSISIGQQFKSRIGGAVLTYIAIYMAMQIVTLVCFLPLMVTVMDHYSVVGYLSTPMEVLPIVNLVLGFGLVYQLVFNGVFFFVTRYMLSKKLNLE